MLSYVPYVTHRRSSFVTTN